MSESFYFDYNGSTPVHPQVIEAYVSSLGSFANPSAAHSGGRRAQAAIGIARARIATSIGARPNEIWFTSGGTESNNWAVFGSVTQALGSHIVVSAIEHKSVLNSAKRLQQLGAECTFVPAGADGVVEAAAVEAAIRPNTVLVAVMLANNETGVIQPIREISAVCRNRGVRFFTDAVTALGKLEIDVVDLGCDLLSLSSHKMYAPKGCGLLYLRESVRLEPLIHGCGQQQGLRSGTENLAAVAAFAKAFELRDQGCFKSASELESLRDLLWIGIKSRFEQAEINGSGPCLANTLNVFFPGLEATELLQGLGQEGFCVSAGAAASNGAASHVLKGMGQSDERARSSLRFSLGAANTRAGIEALLEQLVRVAARVSQVVR